MKEMISPAMIYVEVANILGGRGRRLQLTFSAGLYTAMNMKIEKSHGAFKGPTSQKLESRIRLASTASSPLCGTIPGDHLCVRKRGLVSLQ